MDWPLISVIVPVYNVARYIARGLDSLLGQTYERLEVLLIDDASTDGSGAICDQYAALDPRVQVVHRSENRGVSHARNEGLRRASGEYLTFFDPDDVAEANLLECLLQNLTACGAEVSMCGVRRVGFGPYALPLKDIPPFTASGLEAFFAMLRHEVLSGVAAKLYRSETVKGHTFHEEIHCGEDILFLYGLLQGVQTVRYIPDPLYRYICSGDSATQGKFHARRCTQLQVYAYFCRESAQKFPLLLPQLKLDLVTISIRLAVSAVESRAVPLRAYLKQFRQYVRSYMDWKVLVSFPHKKLMAEAVLLAVSAEVFWAVTVAYKWIKERWA